MPFNLVALKGSCKAGQIKRLGSFGFIASIEREVYSDGA